MNWLVSFRVKRITAMSGHSTDCPSIDYVLLIEEHPAIYFAEMRRILDEFLRNGDRRPLDFADELQRIYSAIEIPDGLLSPDQAERLS